jgi:hypothetical protein
MKTYTIELAVNNYDVGIHEKTSEGFTLSEMRLIIAELELIKQRMINEIVKRQEVLTLEK